MEREGTVAGFNGGSAVFTLLVNQNRLLGYPRPEKADRVCCPRSACVNDQFAAA